MKEEGNLNYDTQFLSFHIFFKMSFVIFFSIEVKNTWFVFS